MSDSENQGAAERQRFQYDQEERFFVDNYVEMRVWEVLARLNEIPALEATITTLKAQVSRKEEEWREAEKEVQFYAGRNADLISENLTLKAQLAAAEEAIRAQPRIQHLQQFPHIKPNQWEQLLLDALSALASGTAAISVEAARKHHAEHGDMDGHTCLLNRCALHYPASDTAGEEANNDNG